ncbi:MAG: response regulator transcription factor [Armatimonadetes bacterium]|nr:response regulator transcription factor [Armatimonadota bacterium]
MKVLVVDDHQLVRDGLVRLLNTDPDIQVVGVAHSGEAAVSLVERTNPDVVLLDVRMPGVGGIPATREIKERWPEVDVVLLTMYDEEEYIYEGLAAGASAYLVKDCSHSQLVQTLHSVHEGGAYLPPQALRKVIGQFRMLREQQPSPSGVPEGLSKREMDVLACVVQGLSNKQIGRRLAIDETTVKTHLHRIFDKLGVRDRTQAAILAIQRGWLRPSVAPQG